MSILNFATETNNASATRTAPANRPQAKLWLNVGVMMNGKFVNLPVGIPLDTMQPVAAKGQNVDWVQFQTARNELLKAIQAAGDTLEAGAAMTIPGLEIQVRHIAEELAPDAIQADNAYAADFSGLFANAVIVEPSKAAE